MLQQAIFLDKCVMMFIEIKVCKAGIPMKKHIILFAAIMLVIILSGCGTTEPSAQIAATTLPVYEFTSRICENTGLTVTQLVTENVSCLHDYALNVDQVRNVESAEIIVISGAGLEDFMSDLLSDKQVIDASAGIALIEGIHEHDHDHGEKPH